MFILIALAVYINATEVNGKIICDYCKEEIKTQYIEIEGKHYHPIHFKCEHCGQPIMDLKYFKKDGHYYCEKCYKELFAPRCAYCGKVIDGKYTVFEGKSYHDSCYEQHVALHCAVTDQQIKGEYLYDFWGNNYIKSLEGKIPRCDYCGRFISDATTGGGITYADGRHICNICRPDAIHDLTTARKLLEDAKTWLARLDIVIDYDKIGLHLVDRNRLRQLSGSGNDNEMGFVEYEYSSYANVVVMKKLDIYILEGIPRLHFISVAAHELMHIWQYLHGKIDNDPVLSEGSCNYASYLVLQYYPGKKKDYLIDNIEHDGSKLYGDGFRRVKKMVKERGRGFWLDNLKNNDKFPGGY